MLINCKKNEQILFIDDLFILLQKKETHSNMASKNLNRIKVVLADKQRTNKWLAEQLGKDKTTISKWCTNSSQPDLESLMKTAKLLNVEVTELLRTNVIE